MLRRPYLSGTLDKDIPVVIDGLSAEFSAGNGSGKVMRGETPFGSQYWGPHVKAFWQIGKLLFHYCEVRERKRGALAKTIERSANDLLETL